MQPTNNSTDELLDQAIQALRESSPNEPSVPLELMASTKATIDGLLQPKSELPTVEQSSQSIRRLVWAGLTIAATLLIGIGILEFANSPRNAAFAVAIEQLQSMRFVSMRMSQQFSASPKLEGTMAMDDKHVRMELFDGMLVNMIDIEKKRAVLLDNQSKTAQLTEMDSKMVDYFREPIERLRNSKPALAKSLGHEGLNGHATEIFQVKDVDGRSVFPGATFQVWIDVDTQLPTRLVFEDTDPKSEFKIVLDEMKWSASVPATLFTSEIPSGYSEVKSVATAKEVEIPSLHANSNSKAQLISGDRVPRSIVWGGNDEYLTVLASDPESTAVQNRKADSIQRWKVESKTLDRASPHHGGGNLGGSQDGQLIAAATGREIRVMASDTHSVAKTYVSKLPIPFVAMSASGQFLAAANADWNAEREKRANAGCIQVWDRDTDKLVCEINEDSVVTFVALSPDGAMVLHNSHAGSTKIWRTATRELLHVFDGGVRAAFSVDGKRVAVAKHLKDGKNSLAQVDIYETGEFALMASLPMPTVKSSILCLAFSNDGSKLAAGSWDKQMLIWSIDEVASKIAVRGPRIEAVGGGVHALSFSSDGGRLASGSEDGALQIWDVR
jgi:WD40 repeat protein